MIEVNGWNYQPDRLNRNVFIKCCLGMSFGRYGLGKCVLLTGIAVEQAPSLELILGTNIPEASSKPGAHTALIVFVAAR